MANKFTHTGIVKGCDSRTPEGAAYKVKLRKTANFWVTEKGTKYRKSSGSTPGEDWPMYRLDLNTIVEIKNPA